jgi:SAM-dependent methyltransferase
MADLSGILQAMRGSPLNERVGGNDPERVGEFCFYHVGTNLDLQAEDHILDFGCGIGRVLVQVANRAPGSVQVVGMDIMPEAIDFCRAHIGPVFGNAAFELIEGSNVHYDKYISGGAAMPRDEVVRRYAGRFTKAYAFSVFTHVDLGDFQALLAFVGALLAPGGLFLFTCFLLTEHTRGAIREGQSTFGFADPAYESGGRVFIGNTGDRLAFIAFDIALVMKMVEDSGLILTRIDFGSWRGSFGHSLQDIVVVQQPRKVR